MRNHAWRKPRLAFLLAAAMLLGLGAATLARPQAEQASEKAKKQKPRQILPTGREDAVPPTAEELAAEQALEQMLSRSTEGLEVIHYADGTMAVDLEGRFMHVVVAGPGPDGKPGVSCITSREALAKLRTPSAAANAPEAPPARPAVTDPETAPAKLEER